MVDGQGSLKSDRAVAVLTNIGGLNVGRALASGCRAVVTATAVTRDAGVVESGR